AAVYAFKLFEATKDSSYFYQGLGLYNWTKNHLQDPEDGLYYDNINQTGRVDKAKYAYNSGQMLQAAALLYKLTGEKTYLEEAEQIAQSAYHRFFHETKDSQGNELRLLNKGNIWFSAVMFRGYIELYKQTKSAVYIKAFQQNMNYAWEHMRDENGLFNTDWSGKEKDTSKWLLTQFAMVEMYTRLSSLEVN
ncbi:MAG: glycoside hydrolase family 76 protein, partial [Bacteroidales bacterium]